MFESYFGDYQLFFTLQLRALQVRDVALINKHMDREKADEQGNMQSRMESCAG